MIHIINNYFKQFLNQRANIIINLILKVDIDKRNFKVDISQRYEAKLISIKDNILKPGGSSATSGSSLLLLSLFLSLAHTHTNAKLTVAVADNCVEALQPAVHLLGLKIQQIGGACLKHSVITD